MKKSSDIQTNIKILYKSIDKWVEWLSKNPNNVNVPMVKEFLKKDEEKLEWYKDHYEEEFI